ncbi:MAG: MFS transporter [Chloroflexi bacterium]|nr:MFS transporter [Chloroflexota bacterium]
MEIQKSPSLTKQLGALTLARLFLNTGVRMVYPFVPVLARGLGVGRTDITRLITLRNSTGFLSPLFGPLSERYGRRIVLTGGMLLFGLGCIVVVIWPTYWALGITLAAMGVAKVIYDPALQAHVGDVVPYARRGRAIAFTEYSWALALLIGAPLTALAMQKWGWQAPFFWLALLGSGAALLLLRSISSTRPGTPALTHLRSSLWFVRHHPVVLYAMLYTALITLANEMLFIVFGSWMEDSFQLSLASLGIAAAVIGGAELMGETIAGWSVDRFGKRPVIITTGLFNALCYLLLPFTSASLTAALLTLFLVFLSFEITVVGGMPLMTELVPSGRVIVMSMIIFAMSMGRTIGAFLGLLLWQAASPIWNGFLWAIIMATAVLILALWIREGT